MAKTVQEVASLLLNIYYNGSDSRQGVRIERTQLRELFEMQRLEGETLRKLHNGLREEGFLFLPVDVDDYSVAKLWMLERLTKVEQWPLVDNSVVERAAAFAYAQGDASHSH